MTRVERVTRQLFGRDLSGGADWGGTDGAWRVARSTYLVCLSSGEWALVVREWPDPDESHDRIWLTSRRWAPLARLARVVRATDTSDGAR